MIVIRQQLLQTASGNLSPLKSSHVRGRIGKASANRVLFVLEELQGITGKVERDWWK